MPCECTDNNKLDNNKILDNDQKLSLESMQTLSIDEIINLYKQGYVLEGLESTIETMSVAYANIVDATGYYDSSLNETWVCAIFTNSGTCGWIRHLAGDDLGSIGTFGEKQQCYPASSTNLLYKAWYMANNPINIAYVKMYTCDTTSSDTCNQAGCVPGATAACTGASTLTASRYNIGVGQFASLTPSPPTNLQVVAGNGQLTFSWTPPSFIDPITGQGIFDYFLEVYDALGNGYDGHILGNATSFTFQNLTNGTQYTCTIRAISRCDTQSTKVTKTGTPTGPITGTIHFAVTTSDGGPINGFEIYLDGSSTMAGTTNTSGIFDATVTGSPSPGTSHSYRIHKTNYTDQTGSVLVISGQISNVSKIMQAIAPVCPTPVISVTCPTSPINQGSVGNIVATITTAGTPNYTYKLYVDAGTTPVDTFGPTTATLHTFSHTFSESSGLHTYKTEVTDSCITPGPKIVSNTCTVTIAVCPTPVVSVTCPTSPINQGSIGSIVATITTVGTPNYTYKLYVDVGTTPVDTFGPTVNTSRIFSHTFNESGGLHTYKVEITDNCTTPGPKIVSSTCTATITGTVPVLTYIVVSPASASIAPVGTKQFTAVCKDQNNTTMACPTLTWLSSNISVATINSTGLATGIAVGSTNITASAGAVMSNTAILTITTAPPSAGEGGAMMIAAIAAIGIAYFMMRKPPTKP